MFQRNGYFGTKKKKEDKGHKGQIHAQINRGVEQKHLAAGRCKTNSLK